MAAPAHVSFAVVCLLAVPSLTCAQTALTPVEIKINSLTVRAEKGDTNAEFLLGLLYDQGKESAVDRKSVV